MEKIYKSDIAIDAFRMRPVDIVIPFDGEFNVLGKLLENIFRTISTNRYQVTVVDVGKPKVSKDAFFRDLAKVRGVVLRKAEKPGVECLKSAFAVCRQPYFLYMEPHVLFEGMNWIGKLGEVLLGQRSIAAVGPVLSTGGEGRQFMTKEEHANGVNSYLLGEDQTLSEACFLADRSVFPLAEMNELSSAEIARAVRKHGGKLAICGKAFASYDKPQRRKRGRAG